MTMYTANTTIYHQPMKENNNFFLQLKTFELHYLFVIVLSIKCTFLFALFAIHWWSILDFRVGASLTFVADECRDNVTVLAGRRFSISFHVLFAFFANGARVTF